MAKSKQRHVLINNSTVRILKPEADLDYFVEAMSRKGHTVVPIKAPPSIRTMAKWNMDGVAKATDGCRVEPDGECPHGKKSWLLVLGVI